MKQSVGVLLVLVGITALSGCSGFGGPSGPTETVTPAPVPETTVPTDEPNGPLPPGLSGGGVTDADVIAQAHLDALPEKSYRWHARTTFQGNRSDQLLTVEGPKTYAYRYTSPGALTNTSEFADGETVYTRYYRFVERLRRAPAPNATDQYGPIAAGAIERYLAVENATVAETVADGRLHYRVRATTDRYRRIGGATDYTVTAVIAPEGFVRSLNVSYVNRGGDRPIDVTHRFRYDAVGRATVERPNWLSEDQWATNPTATATPTTSDT